MWLKIVIIVLFLALVISLGSGLVFLLKDQGKGKRTMHSLGVRVGLAAALLVLISYGLATGQLTSQAPWDRSGTPTNQQ